MPKINQEVYESEGEDKEADIYTRRMKYIAQAFSDLNSESEETEAKKDIEWLKEEILGLRKNGNTESNQTEAEKEMGRLQKWAWDNCADRVYELINQLDEPEVLSQEWVRENEEQEYLIHNTDDEMDGYYLAKFSLNSKGHLANIGWVSNLCNPMVSDALRFDSKERAEAVALLVDGEVEELEE